MTIPTIDPQPFSQKTRQIRAQVTNVLTKWGLLPRFKRWRLTQDSDSGMVVLFGVLNNNYIAAHTSIPFSDYFDPRLLRDLANELQVQVVSCNSDGAMSYAQLKEDNRCSIFFASGDEPKILRAKEGGASLRAKSESAIKGKILRANPYQKDISWVILMKRIPISKLGGRHVQVN